MQPISDPMNAGSSANLGIFWEGGFRRDPLPHCGHGLCTLWRMWSTVTGVRSYKTSELFVMLSCMSFTVIINWDIQLPKCIPRQWEPLGLEPPCHSSGYACVLYIETFNLGFGIDWKKVKLNGGNSVIVLSSTLYKLTTQNDSIASPLLRRPWTMTTTRVGP